MRIAPIAHTHVRQVKAGCEYENCKFRAGDILLLSLFGKIHREPGAPASTHNRSVDRVHPGQDKAHRSMARHDQTWLHRGLLLEKRKYAKEMQLPTIKSKGLESRPNPLGSPTVNTVIQFCKLIPLTL